MKKFLLILSIILCSSVCSRIYASHVMGADLTFACLGPNTYLVTLEAYRDCNGIELTGPLTINYSSAQCGVNSTLTLNQVGPPTDITPTCFANTDACNGGTGYGIQKFIFQGTLHLPAGCGSDWVLSWTLCCRNAAITTLNNPSNDNLYIEANLNNTTSTCVSSPTFANDPIAIYCDNFPQLFNHGAVAPNGDSLYYYLMPSLTAAGTPVSYISPLSATNPISASPPVTINSATGQLSFTPNATQVAVMKVGVNEYQNGVLVAHVERDMQVIITTCTNSAPTAGGINGQTGANANTFTTTACSNSCFTIQTADSDPTDSVFYTWVNTNLPGATISSSGGLKPLLTICWAPTQADVGTHSFIINLRNNDCPYNGTASIAYTVVVTAANDPPVSAGPDVYLCPGQSTTLSASSTGTVTSYTWSDGTNTHSGQTWTVNPTVTTVYTVTAVYANGCALTDQVVVYREPTPTVTAFPPISTICSTSDTVQINAISTNAASYLWSPAAGLTCTTCPAPKISPTVSTTYTVIAYDSAGCPSAPFSVTVNLNSPPPTQSCSVIYATTTGTGTGTQSSPASLANALALAQCNNALIKLGGGQYQIDFPITNIGSNTTLEGGFDPANNWIKNSTPGYTTIYRNAINLEGSSTTKRLVAVYLNGAQYVRFQDLTIQTANCPAISGGDTFGYSNYVFVMTNCSNYNFVRCQIIPGSASGGLVGTNAAGTGTAGANGINCTGSGTAGAPAPVGPNAGGAGGNGGSGGTVSGGSGTAGSAGTGSPGGAGGSAGSGGTTCPSVGILSGGAGGPGTAGTAGANGTTGATGSAGSFAGGFYVDGGLGGNGGAGTTGNGGGGGGGGGGAGADYTGSGGGSGGSGGGGGPGGYGGAGGGGCFGLFMNNNGANGIILECNIGAVAPGAGGTGGTGGTGGNGGTGGSANANGNGCSNTTGNGGNGGKGGNGGNGGSGANGAGARVYIVSGSALAGGDTIFNLSAEPTIYATNIACTNKNDTLSSANSGAWTTGTGATVPSGTGVNIITQYTTTGRKDITYTGDTYSGFVDIELNQSTFVPVIQSSASVYQGDTFYVCQGSTADFNMLIASADTFYWNFGGATVPNTYTGANDQNLNNLTFNTAGTFMILGGIKTSCCGWSPYDTVYLLVEPTATLGYTGTKSFCPGDSAHIILSGTGTSYLWAPAAGLSSDTATNVYAFPQATTSYLVTSYSPHGLCNADTNITITRDTQPTISFNVLPASCGSDGSITAVPSPAGTYTYLWSPTGLTTATINNQPSGTYSVTVTPSGSSCSTTASTSLGTNGGVQAYMAKNISPLCNGQCTGQLRVEAIGGASPYTYQWSPTPSAIDSVNSLCAGTYNVTITDHNGCTATTSAVVAQPLPLVLAVVDSSSPHCFGQCTGSARVDGQGGTGPYDFTWSPAVSDSNTAVNLCVGAYAITVTDNNHCTAAGGVTITSPPQITLSFAKINDSCFSDCDGRLTATVNGGASPFTYHWNNGTTGPVDSNLCAAIYMLTVTDDSLCTSSASDTITAPLLLVASISSSINDSCNGQCNGRAVATATGGTSPYTFTWNNGTTGATDSNLCIGIYTVTVKDALGCTATVKDTITQPTVLTVTSIISDVTCFGLCNGGATAVPAGGTSPYTYVWSNATTTAEDTNLCMGPYTVTVKDDKGCTVSEVDNITQPTPLTLSVTNVVNDNCFNACDGSVTVLAAGGTLNYSYTWSNTQTGATANNLCQGTYTATVTDGHACTATVSQAISQPTQIAADTTLTTQEVSCNGGTNGSLTLIVSGGTYPYTYVWPQSPTNTDSIATGLAAGTYTPIITDANGCKDTLTAYIVQPNVLVASVVFDSIACAGQTADTATGSATGGTQPYSYQLDGAGGFQASGMFTGLSVGMHTIEVQDANGCTSSVSFTIFSPTPLTGSIVSTFNNLCFDSCQGIITVQASGGVSPYEYSINGGSESTSPIFSSLCANPNYTIVITDSHGCTFTLTDAITQPSAIVPAFVSAVAPTCNNGTNGSFTVSATGGTPGAGYTYSSDGGPFQSSGTFAPEAAGNHLVTVMDANGCTDTITVTVPNPPASTTFTSSITNVTCPGGDNGSVTLTVNGANGPYSFVWSPGGATTQNDSNLIAGTYIVEITDVNGCEVYGADSINIVTQPNPITATNPVTEPTCFDGSNGSILVTPSGGTQPYTNSWSNGSTSGNPTGLTAGTYSDTITDANGCQYIDAGIIVGQPDSISIVVDSVTAVSCVGLTNGAIAITASGGTPGYTYAWTPGGGTSDPLTNIGVGSYMVIVTDSHGCPDTANVVVGIDSPLLFNAAKTNVLCPPLQNGSITLTVSGGSPGYQYAWSNGATTNALTGLNVGIDSVTVTDSRGCAIDTGFVITNDSAYHVSIDPDTTIILNEGNDVVLELGVSGNGGTASSIIWVPSIGLSCADCADPIATPVNTTQYIVQTVSSLGCTSIDSILIIVIPQHQLYIPNAFTPNGDGINDFWEVFGNKKVWIYVSVAVFDRWGEKVFESTDLNFAWDGKYKGTFVEPGVYVYNFEVTFLDGYTAKNKGTVTVIR